MALIGLIGAFTIATVVAVWATVRVIHMSIADDADHVLGYTERIWTIWMVFVVSMLMVEFWPGLAHWTDHAVQAIVNLL